MTAGSFAYMMCIETRDIKQLRDTAMCREERRYSGCGVAWVAGARSIASRLAAECVSFSTQST